MLSALFTAGVILTHHWGYVSAVGSALLFGISSTLNKIALAKVNPTVIAGMVYFIGGIVLFAVHVSPLRNKILKIFETPGTEAKFSRRDFLVS
jgi:drug/metabolite transporter (DMT)-like permease